MINDKEFINDLYRWKDVEYFKVAMDIAIKAHEGQSRDEGTPYIDHINGVINILKEEFDIQSDTVLSVAAMHDVLEDSPMYSYEDLQLKFGDLIANAVLLLTKNDNQDFGSYMFNIKNALDMSWLIYVKFADRIHNLRCLKFTNRPDKIKRKCEETRRYILCYAAEYPEINKIILNELAKLEVTYDNR